MPKFRKKPVVIDAVKWGGDLGDPEFIIPTLEGDMRCPVGHWVIKGVEGELSPCDPDIFEKTYELVS